MPNPHESRTPAGLGRTIPALPVRDVHTAAGYYRARFGFAAPHEADDFAVLVYEELRETGVLHPVAQNGVAATDFGTREFATLDLDGNLLTFFRRTG